METHPLVWINEKRMAGDSASAAIICEKAKQMFEDEDKGKSHNIPAEGLKELFSCWNKLSKLMKNYQPSIAAVEMGFNHFSDTLMDHFWRV
jgi:hypothetical protein